MPTNTKFRPNNQNSFDSDSQLLNLVSTQAVVEPNETKSIDLPITEDILLQGCEKFLVYDSHKDDKISLQIIHPATMQVVPNGQFATDLFIDPTVVNQNFTIPTYTAKLPAGLILRCVYKASAMGAQRDVRINWLLHKVLA